MTEAAPGAVMVVDDDDGYRELLVLALQEHCRVPQVEAFADAGEAVGTLRARPAAALPALALLDLHMPRLDGLGVLRALRAAGVRVPVVVLSGAVTPGERRACLEAGATAVLQKPALFEQLVEVLAGLVGGPHPQRQFS